MKLKKTLTLFVLFLFALQSFAQNKKGLAEVNLEDFFNETLYNLGMLGSDNIRLVLWNPSEFWKTICNQQEMGLLSRALS